MALTDDQRGIVRGGAIALVVTLVFGIPAYLWLPPAWLGAEALATVADRFAFAIRWDIPILIWLAACVRVVSRGRFKSAADIGGSAFSKPSPMIAVKRAVLQNSLEQTVLAAGAHLALAVTLRGRELVLIPILVLLYLAGRVWFAAGYAAGAPGRAPGMVLTAGPTFAALMLAGALALLGR